MEEAILIRFTGSWRINQTNPNTPVASCSKIRTAPEKEEKKKVNENISFVRSFVRCKRRFKKTILPKFAPWRAFEASLPELSGTHQSLPRPSDARSSY